MQKITVIGRLGKTPEERVTSKGIKVIGFSIAVYASKERTQWYEITIWEDRIPIFERILQYLDKGSRVCIIGDLGTPDPYQSHDGSIKVRMKIVPNSISFISGEQKPKETSIF